MRSLQKDGYDFSVTDYLRAASKGDVEAISRFRQSGMGVDVKDASQNTALIAAAIRGNSSLVGQLLREGANPNHYNSQGRGALHAAAEVGDVTSLRSLIAHKAETQRTDRENWSALSLAAFAGHVEAVRVLTPVSDHHLDRALHLASLNGDIDIIDALAATTELPLCTRRRMVTLKKPGFLSKMEPINTRSMETPKLLWTLL